MKKLSDKESRQYSMILSIISFMEGLQANSIEFIQKAFNDGNEDAIGKPFEFIRDRVDELEIEYNEFLKEMKDAEGVDVKLTITDDSSDDNGGQLH